MILSSKVGATPIKGVFSMCGGPERVAEWLGTHPTTPYKWLYAGHMPEKHIHPLIVEARANGIDLRPEHFFPPIPPLGWREK